MTDDRISLKTLERRAFTLQFEDGLWDIFLGLFPLEFALAPLLSDRLGDLFGPLVFLPVLLLGWIAVRLLKKHVVTPRLGTVRLSRSRLVRSGRYTMAVFSLLILALVVVGIVALRTGTGAVLQTALFACLLLAGFSVAAWLMNVQRLYVYGALLALAPVLGEWLWASYGISHHGYPLTFGAAAAIIMAIGIVRFTTFMRTYAIPVEA